MCPPTVNFTHCGTVNHGILTTESNVNNTMTFLLSLPFHVTSSRWSAICSFSHHAVCLARNQIKWNLSAGIGRWEA